MHSLLVLDVHEIQIKNTAQNERTKSVEFIGKFGGKSKLYNYLMSVYDLCLVKKDGLISS